METTNLDDSYGASAQDWPGVTAILEKGFNQAPESGGPNRFTTWLTTLNADGSPHMTAVGAVWVDGAFWFQTGDVTRKARNVARDPRCAMSLSTHEFDLVVEGAAEKTSDPDAVARVAAAWAEGGWPCEVDASGIGITAPFNAPAIGPAPWFVYRITPRSATSVSTTENGGATTRWDF